MDDEDYFAQQKLNAQRRLNQNWWYDYKTDPLYYAADRIRQKRRQKYSSSRPLTIVRDERRVVPPPTNGELQ